MKSIEEQASARIMALGFMVIILTGSLFSMLPMHVKPGVSFCYADTLLTLTSAVCITGLTAVDTADMYTVLGQVIVAFLIQVDGLGVTSVGAGVILALGCRANLKERLLIKKTMNLDLGRGIVCIVENILETTLRLGGAGAALSYFVFSRDYPPLKVLGISLFRSMIVSSNSDFDILGGLQSPTGYRDNILSNLITSGLIIFGGLGSLVVMGITEKRSFKKLCLHFKAVIVTTLILLTVGTMLLRLTEDIMWLSTFSISVPVKTTGFITFSLSDFTMAGLLTITVLTFIGTSPGSTGGGIKISTLPTLFHTIKGAVTNIQPHVFHYKIPQEALYKAAIVTALPSLVVISGILCICVLEPGLPSKGVILEITSAFGTVGLSIGITPGLSPLSKLLEVLIMYIGRLRPLIIVTIRIFKPDTSIPFPKGSTPIGRVPYCT